MMSKEAEVGIPELEERTQSQKDKNTGEEAEDLFLRLYGRNLVNFCQVFGTLTDLLVGFPGLKGNLKVHTYDFSIDRVYPQYAAASQALINIRANKRLLIDLEKEGGLSHGGKIKMHDPFEVFVLAKRKVSVSISYSQQVTFIGTFIVGDESGLCKMVMFNDAIDSVYKWVEVGDKLLINGGIYCNYLVSEHFHGFIYPGAKTLSIEIKPNVFEARHIYIIKDNLGNNNFKATISNVLKGQPNSKLWSVNDLNSCGLYPGQAETGAGEAAELNSEEKEILNVDIIGIIKYAGRLERCGKLNKTSHVLCCTKANIATAATADKPTLGDYKVEYQQFTGSRWIELIDIVNPEGKSSLVRIHVNSMTSWNLQKSLIPGNVLIVTHMLFRPGYLQTSAYSELLLFPSDIPNYIRRMPANYLDTAKQYWNVEPWKRCLNKAELSLGGFYFRNILNHEIVKKEELKYQTNIKCSAKIPKEPFINGETKRIVVSKGRIVRRYEAGTDIPFCPTTVTQDTNSVSERAFHCFGPLIPNEVFRMLCFRRKLPPINTDDLSKNVDVLSRLDTSYNEHFATFCMQPFARQLECLSDISGNLEVMAKPYCILEIEDAKEHWIYNAYWVTETKEVMNDLLQQAEGKEVLVFLDILRIHYPSSPLGYAYEIIISDFTPIPDKQTAEMDTIDLEMGSTNPMIT